MLCDDEDFDDSCKYICEYLFVFSTNFIITDNYK